MLHMRLRDVTPNSTTELARKHNGTVTVLVLQTRCLSLSLVAKVGTFRTDVHPLQRVNLASSQAPRAFWPEIVLPPVARAPLRSEIPLSQHLYATDHLRSYFLRCVEITILGVNNETA